jgi:hypothetical protein
MSLRLQLLAFGLLTLFLPWAGMRFVAEMENALRSGFEAALRASAGTVAAAIENQVALDDAENAFAYDTSESASTIYAQPLRADMQIDGRRDDWRLDLVPGLALDDAHTLWAGVHERFAYLFIEVADEDLVYQAAPGATPHGDRVVLLVRPEGTAPRWLLLLTAAQGAFRAQTTVPGTFAPTGRYEDRVVGAWQETSRGFAVETRIPLGLVEAGLGVAIVDVDTVGSDGDASSGAFSVPTVV